MTEAEAMEADVEAALALDAEWRKQESDPAQYRQGKHVYPDKVMPRHLHVLADEVECLEARLAYLEDLLRGFLWDADQNDRPGRGLRDMARAALSSESETPDAIALGIEESWETGE